MVDKPNTGRMMRALLLALVLAVGPMAAVAAQTSLMEGRKQFAGEIKKQGVGSRDYLASEKQLRDLWAHWEMQGPPPSIDFRKDIAVVHTGHGGIVLMKLVLENDGNLVAQFVQAPVYNYWPGYLIVAVSRTGVKSVNGKLVKQD